MQANFVPDTMEFRAVVWLFNRKTRVSLVRGPRTLRLLEMSIPPGCGVVRGQKRDQDCRSRSEADEQRVSLRVRFAQRAVIHRRPAARTAGHKRLVLAEHWTLWRSGSRNSVISTIARAHRFPQARAFLKSICPNYHELPSPLRSRRALPASNCAAATSASAPCTWYSA